MTADTSHHSDTAPGDGQCTTPAEHGHDMPGPGRHTVEVQLPEPMGRRPLRHGGGAATLLVVRNGDQVELFPHPVHR